MISFLLPSKSERNVTEFMKEIEALNLPIGQIITCNDSQGKGKGYAVREALKQATGDVIVFIDADGDISPKMVYRLMPFLMDYDIVVGVKPISGLWSRRILTYLSRIYIALLFDVKVDTQTGIKAFKRAALGSGDWYSNGWLFDIEILSDAKKKGFSLTECPIEYTPSNRPMKFRSIWETLKESVTLWLETR